MAKVALWRHRIRGHGVNAGGGNPCHSGGATGARKARSAKFRSRDLARRSRLAVLRTSPFRRAARSPATVGPRRDGEHETTQRSRDHGWSVRGPRHTDARARFPNFHACGEMPPARRPSCSFEREDGCRLCSATGRSRSPPPKTLATWWAFATERTLRLLCASHNRCWAEQDLVGVVVRRNRGP